MKNDNKNYKKKAEKILFLFLVGIILYSSLVLSSPTMNITSPLNQTYNSQTIFNLNYTTTLDTISSWYSVDKGVTNVSFANLPYIIAFDNFTANFTSGFGWASTWSNSSFNKTGIITLNGSQTARVSNATLFNRHFNASLFAGKNVTITFGAGTNTTKNCSYYFYTNDTSSVLLLTLNSTTSVRTITNYSFDLSSQDFSKNSSFGVLPSTPSNITDYCFLNNVNISSTIPSLSTSGINANQGGNFWQVFGNSSTGIGSANLSFFVDTIAPVFNIIPVNLSINYSLPINVQFNITDNLQVSYVFVNDTRFNITQNDILTNATALSVGTYLINISANDTFGNINFIIYQVIVNKIASQTSLNFDKSSPQSYGTAITPICSLITGLGSVSLINGTSGIPETLGVNTWNFNCSYAGNQNYTSSSNQTYFTISKSNSNCQVFFNITSPKVYTTKFLVYTDCDSNFNLYRNGTSITNNSVQSLSIGTYNFSVFRIDTQNYSNIFNESDFILISAVPNLSLSFFPSNSVLYGTSMNVSGLGCPSEITCNLYEDGVLVLNPYYFNAVYGTNSFVYNTTGNTNYSANSVSGTLNVFDNVAPSGNAISPIVNTTSPVNFTINASDDGGSGLKNITYNIFNSTGLFNRTSVNVTGTTATTNILFDLVDGIYNWFASIFDIVGNLFNTLNATILVDKTPPSVIVINPQPTDNQRPIGKSVGININDSDLHGISYEYLTLQFPNGSYINQTFTNGLESNSFGNVSQWVSETNSPYCNITIVNNHTLNTYLNGTYHNITDFTCSYISNDLVYQDFDMNVSFNVNQNITHNNDTEMNFEITTIPSSINSTDYIFMDLSDVSGLGRKYEVFADVGNFSGYLMQRPTNDTYGKFRITRTGSNFNFYTWDNINGSWNQEIVSQSTFSLPHSLFVLLESENFYNDYGLSNITWTNFSLVQQAVRVSKFNQTFQDGTYNIRFFVNDTFGNLNDSQITFFRINTTNIAPTTPFLLTPIVNSIDFGNITIKWTLPFDANNDFLKYNITLLNPDLSINQTIVSGYGDSSSIYYVWNSTQKIGGFPKFVNGNYSLALQVYEAITPEHYSKTNILGGNFTLDNTISCPSENFTGMQFAVPTYPYVDINSNYTISLLSPINPYSNINLYLTEPNGTIDIFPFTYINNQFMVTLNFDKLGNYPFIISGKSLCVNITDNVTGTLLVRNPFNLTICGFNDKTGTPYKNNFATLTAEFSSKNFDPNLDRFIVPLGFQYTFKTPVFHADYINGCGTLQLFEPNQEYTLRLFDGQTTFNGTYAEVNMSKSYGTNIVIGQQRLNGTSENLNVYLSPTDIHPFFSLFNWILVIVIFMSIIISIILFFMFADKPQVAISFGIIMIGGSILLRVIVFFWLG